MEPGMLIDTTMCIGCGACALACKEQNKLRMPVENKNTAYTWKSVQQVKGYFVPRMCMHCEHPSCAAACPVGALKKTKEGAVVYYPKKCIGCRYCVQACPFMMAKYQWDTPFPLVGKCILCYPRLKEGKTPACATVCPTGATKFGKRDELIKEAKERIKNNPKRYYPYIYGLKEAGGTTVLYLSAIPFDQLGFKMKGMQETFPEYTWKIMKSVPTNFFLTGVICYGLWWVINRREKLQGKDEHNDEEH